MERTVVDIGDSVMCDFCDLEYNTEPASKEVGGILFGSKAACPKCAPRIEASAKKYDETHFIKDRAEPGETFREFCLRLRAGCNQIVTLSFNTAEELAEYMKSKRKPNDA